MDPSKKTAEVGVQQGETVVNYNGLHRRIGNRQIQLFAIGASIGTALFVSIGTALAKAGPGSLLIAFIIYACIVALINNCMAEMTVLMPVSGGFVRLAGNWVDEALGFSVGINFFLYEAISVPFEITAINIILGFWRNDIPVAAICAACIIVYGLINLAAVKYYGEAEFWLSTGKVILIIMFFCFTFITMVGGHPKHDAYGFRYWNEPGPFAEWRSTGSLGRFEGFLAAFWFAPLMIVGPEYISMVASEAVRPRVVIKNAFKTIYWRFAVFFIGGALCVGIIVPYNDPTLVGLITGTASGAGTAAASPYVVAMRNLGIGVLPDVVNALLLTSIFSAGNTYVYCASRTLYGLALDGQAPKFLTHCTNSGVPIYSLAVTMIFPFLSFLQTSNSASVVLDWLINLLTSGGLVNYIVVCITYLRFQKACKAQGVDRKTLPYYGWFQPHAAWIALVALIAIALCSGYTVFITGSFTVGGLFTKYAMLMVAPILYGGWKLVKRTRTVKSHEVDLVWERVAIDAYEEALEEKQTTFFEEMKGMFLWRRKANTGNDA